MLQGHIPWGKHASTGTWVLGLVLGVEGWVELPQGWSCHPPAGGLFPSQGHLMVPVLIGCPPGKRLAFDVTYTIMHSQNLNKHYFDCVVSNSEMPCFLYRDCVSHPFSHAHCPPVLAILPSLLHPLHHSPSPSAPTLTPPSTYFLLPSGQG